MVMNEPPVVEVPDSDIAILGAGHDVVSVLRHCNGSYAATHIPLDRERRVSVGHDSGAYVASG